MDISVIDLNHDRESSNITENIATSESFDLSTSPRVRSESGATDITDTNSTSSADSAIGLTYLSDEDSLVQEEDVDSFLPIDDYLKSMWPLSKKSCSDHNKSIGEELIEFHRKDQNDNELKGERSELCQSHREQKGDFYCEVCNVVICVRCKSEKHDGHKFTTLQSAKLQTEGKFKKLQTQIQEKRDNTLAEIASIQEYRNQLITKGENLSNEIASRRDLYHKMIDKWFEKTNFTLNTALEDEADHIQRMLKTLHLSLGPMSDICDRGEQMENALEGLNLTESHDNISTLEKIHETKLPCLDRKMGFLLGAGSNITQAMLGNLSCGLSEPHVSEVTLLSHGKLVQKFDSRNGQKAQSMASGLSLTKEGGIVVSDIGTDLVNVFDEEGNHKVQLNTMPLQHPTKAIEMLDGKIAVACKNSVKFFTKGGEYVDALECDLFCPSGLAKNRNGDLIVTDMGERQAYISIYARADYRQLHTIIGGRKAPAFHNAWNITVSPQDNIVVSDYTEHCIKVFNPLGVLVHEFGQKGADLGQFFHPAGICSDSQGNIFVADCMNNRVQMFSPNGEFLAVIVNDVHGGLYQPTDVAIDKLGQLVVLQGNGQVKSYKFVY